MPFTYIFSESQNNHVRIWLTSEPACPFHDGIVTVKKDGTIWYEDRYAHRVDKNGRRIDETN